MEMDKLINEVNKLKGEVYYPTNKLQWDYRESLRHAEGQTRAYNSVISMIYDMCDETKNKDFISCNSENIETFKKSGYDYSLFME